MVYVGTCPERPFSKTTLFIKDTVHCLATMPHAYVLNQGLPGAHTLSSFLLTFFTSRTLSSKTWSHDFLLTRKPEHCLLFTWISQLPPPPTSDFRSCLSLQWSLHSCTKQCPIWFLFIYFYFTPRKSNRHTQIGFWVCVSHRSWQTIEWHYNLISVNKSSTRLSKADRAAWKTRSPGMGA